MDQRADRVVQRTGGRFAQNFTGVCLVDSLSEFVPELYVVQVPTLYKQKNDGRFFFNPWGGIDVVYIYRGYGTPLPLPNR